MYNIKNKKKYIGRIQELLGVRESGILDLSTRNAILSLKASQGLGEDWQVDYATFRALLSHSRNKNNNLYLLKLGDYSSSSLRLNTLLSFLISYLRLECPTPRGSLYSRTTEQAICEISHHIGGCDSREELFRHIEYIYSVLSKIT